MPNPTPQGQPLLSSGVLITTEPPDVSGLISFLHPKPIQVRGTLCKQSGLLSLLTLTHKCVLAAPLLAPRQPELSWHSKLMHRSWPELLILSLKAPYHPRIPFSSLFTVTALPALVPDTPFPGKSFPLASCCSLSTPFPAPLGALLRHQLLWGWGVLYACATRSNKGPFCLSLGVGSS